MQVLDTTLFQLLTAGQQAPGWLVFKAIPLRKGLWSLTERAYMRALGWLF